MLLHGENIEEKKLHHCCYSLNICSQLFKFILGRLNLHGDNLEVESFWECYILNSEYAMTITFLSSP